MDKAQTRLDWVDMAKGLSIFLVVIMYCATSVGEDTGQAGFLHWSIAWAMPFRMPEFFVLSGLFLSQVIGREWKPYADRRVIHYFYFYALWAVIHIVFKELIVGRDVTGTAASLAWAIVSPYGILWFIYMLGVFGLVSKLLYSLKAPHWAVLGVSALLQMANIKTGSYLVDQFAEYFVYFQAGYVAAPYLFRLADWVADHAALSLAGLVAWGIVNGLLVFSPGFHMDPVHPQMGWAALPGLHLILALAGSAAVCVAAALLIKLPWMAWLRWLGSKSLIIYVSFVLPMGVARIILLRFGLSEPNIVSLIIMVVSIGSPLILWWLVQKTGFGRFLFERPHWAHLPGTRRGAKPLAQPAE